MSLQVRRARNMNKIDAISAHRTTKKGAPKRTLCVSAGVAWGGLYAHHRHLSVVEKKDGANALIDGSSIDDCSMTRFCGHKAYITVLSFTAFFSKKAKARDRESRKSAAPIGDATRIAPVINRKKLLSLRRLVFKPKTKLQADKQKATTTAAIHSHLLPLVPRTSAVEHHQPDNSA